MAETTITEQRCYQCKETKPASAFSRKSSKSNGLCGTCKNCHNARVRIRYAEGLLATTRKPSREVALAEISPERVSEFWGRVHPAPNGCLEWQGWRRKKGYGEFSIRGVNFIATHVAYRIYYLINPEPQAVLHRCDNPPCVNPLHLFLGTGADNVRDMCAKGRQARGATHGINRFPDRCVKRGSKHKIAKLTETQVIEMRTRYANGNVSQKQLAAEYGISAVRVGMIINRKAWVHI